MLHPEPWRRRRTHAAGCKLILDLTLNAHCGRYDQDFVENVKDVEAMVWKWRPP